MEPWLESFCFKLLCASAHNPKTSRIYGAKRAQETNVAYVLKHARANIISKTIWQPKQVPLLSAMVPAGFRI